MPQDKLTIIKGDLESAAAQGAMSPLDVEPLWQHLAAQQVARINSLGTPSSSSSSVKNTASTDASVGNGERFGIADLAWYGGGTLVMIALAYFMFEASSSFGSGSLFGLSLLYIMGFGMLGERLLKQGASIPAGVLYTVAVLLVPLATAAGLDTLHLLRSVHQQTLSLVLEGVTFAFALAAVRKSRCAMVTAPLYGALWLFSITLAWILTGNGNNDFFWFVSDLHHYNVLSMLTGLALLAGSVVVDSRLGRRPDYSWWGYFFGSLAFWIPLSLLDSGGEFGRFAYFLVNIALLVSSVVLNRRVLRWAGALGAIYYIGHVLSSLVVDAMSFACVLIALGVGIILLGVQYRKRQAAIEAAILNMLPQSLRDRLPGRD